MTELKPCPCCGGEAVISPHTSKGLYLRCKSCKLGYKQKVLRLTLEWLEEKMIENWNRRVTKN